VACSFKTVCNTSCERSAAGPEDSTTPARRLWASMVGPIPLPALGCSAPATLQMSRQSVKAQKDSDTRQFACILQYHGENYTYQTVYIFFQNSSTLGTCRNQDEDNMGECARCPQAAVGLTPRTSTQPVSSKERSARWSPVGCSATLEP
jgi:hypothetical protein